MNSNTAQFGVALEIWEIGPNCSKIGSGFLVRPTPKTDAEKREPSSPSFATLCGFFGSGLDRLVLQIQVAFQIMGSLNIASRGVKLHAAKLL